MARNAGRLASEVLRINDPTIAMAVDVVATFVLSEIDRAEADRQEARRIETVASMLTGGRAARPEVEWETVEEL